MREGADLAVTFRSLGGARAILEGVVPFQKESLGRRRARARRRLCAYDLCENTHDGGILRRTRAPAEVEAATAADAVAIAARIADALGLRRRARGRDVRDAREAAAKHSA